MPHMQTYGHAYINIHTYARACTCLDTHTRAHTAIKEGVVNKSALSENLYQQNKFLLNFCLALRDSETDARKQKLEVWRRRVEGWGGVPNTGGFTTTIIVTFFV